MKNDILHSLEIMFARFAQPYLIESVLQAALLTLSLHRQQITRIWRKPHKFQKTDHCQSPNFKPSI